jgi:hypothetical protein
MKKTNVVVFLSLFNLIFYFSMISFWSGIQGMLGVSWLAYLLLGIIAAVAIAAITFRLLRINNLAVLIMIIFSGLITGVLAYMFYMGIGSLHYVLRTFRYGLFVLAFITLIYYIIFIYPKCKLAKMKCVKLTLFFLLLLLILINVFDLRVNFISAPPVVYAVEDEYQIVWVTNADSVAAVEVGEHTYYDLYAGSQRSETKVHKVVVPMSVLDSEKSYTISSTSIIYRGPYSGIKGRTIKKTYTFHPVDLSDGLNYYAISDTHEYARAASRTGTYFGDDLDFLILLGDISSHLERPEDITLINKIAYRITKSQRPVIYARGNHEVKADLADQLYKYVGSKNEKFYYTFNLSGVFGIVLDLGEDHDDDWWEYYGLAHYDLYRQEQTAFLNQVISEAAYEDDDVQYRMLISHIPVAYVYDGFLEDIKLEWTSLLNQIGLDIAVSGHHHQLLPITRDIPANTEFLFHENYGETAKPKAKFRTDSNFDTFIVSRRSNVQDVKVKENLFGRKISGLAVTVDFTDKMQSIRYTNTLKKIVEVVDPYSGLKYQAFNIAIY